jgi:acyl dehydratase
MAVKAGWRGRFCEDFEVGNIYRHSLGRMITATDNIWFTLLSQNDAPLHFDHHYASQTELGSPRSTRPSRWRSLQGRATLTYPGTSSPISDGMR